MRFYDKSGLDPEISRSVHHKFYKEFKIDTIENAHILLCATEEIEIPTKNNFRYFVIPMTNTDHIKVLEGVKLISLEGESEFLMGVTSTAEHTLYLMLSLLKRKSRREAPGHTLFDKTIGIIGMGRIGTQLFKLFNSMGCYSIGVDLKDHRWGFFDISKVLSMDIITIHASVKPNTRPILGEEELSRVKDGAYIINTSRPCLIDNKAMFKHIDRLGGFASDFLLPIGLALKPNVIITNHTGGYTIEDLTKTSEFCFEKLMRVISSNM